MPMIGNSFQINVKLGNLALWTWLSGLNFPLLGAFVSLLANRCVLYHIMSKKSNEINKKVRDLPLCI